MTFYQELQLKQAGSKNLLKKSETLKEKLYQMWVYLVKIAATMAFCFFFVSIFSILFGNENSIVGVVIRPAAHLHAVLGLIGSPGTEEGIGAPIVFVYKRHDFVVRTRHREISGLRCV